MRILRGLTGLRSGDIVCSESELDLDRVLMSGQTFRWERDSHGWWTGVIGRPQHLVRVRRSGELLEYETTAADGGALIADYFRLETRLSDLCPSWQGSEVLTTAFTKHAGLRVLRQDPVECLFGFICSAAAPIHRIRRSVSGMCRTYGECLGEWQGVSQFQFPTLEALARGTRADLDQLGLGFRGRYIPEAAAQVLARGGAAWLLSLRQEPYVNAHAALVALSGVGSKVADCVCLFSLDHDCAVPIDVHMARVVQRIFPELNRFNSLTQEAYTAAGDSFRARYGRYAGWAQQYFFFGEIAARGLWDPQLNRHRPADVIREVEKVV